VPKKLTSPTRGVPAARQASTAAPSERACSSPRVTGSVGTPPTNAVQTSVPPEVENSQTSPSCSCTQSNPSGGSGEPVDPTAWSAERSPWSASETPAFAQAPMYAALVPKIVIPASAAKPQSAPVSG
jgi:hypothetical protein